MNLAAVASGTAERLERTRDLNAALAWSAHALAVEAARVEALGPGGGLHGMPVAVKDNIVTTDLPTTCASRMLEGYRSPFNATVIDRLRSAGAMVACKANMDEFAMGGSTEHSAYGRVHHPLDPTRVPGGSSGGSAALVAAPNRAKASRSPTLRMKPSPRMKPLHCTPVAQRQSSSAAAAPLPRCASRANPARQNRA